MFQYNDHITKIETDDLAQDIALTIRQAQVYGISASASNIGSEKFDEDEGYVDDFFDADSGVVRDITQDKSIRGISFYFDDKKIILFTDVNRNHVYDNGDIMIDERKITYPNTSFINFGLCKKGSCTEKKGRVDVTFERPYPDATIFHMSEPDSIASAVQYASLSVVVGKEDHKRSVEINSIGNIVVK
jgi:hypothetical protein